MSCHAVVVLLSCHCSPPPLLPSILIQFNTIIVAVNHVGPHTQTLVILSRSRSNSQVHNPTTILFYYSTQLHLASHIHTPVCLSILLLGSSIGLQQLQQQQFVICFAFVFSMVFCFFQFVVVFTMEVAVVHCSSWASSIGGRTTSRAVLRSAGCAASSMWQRPPTPDDYSNSLGCGPSAHCPWNSNVMWWWRWWWPAAT